MVGAIVVLIYATVVSHALKVSVVSVAAINKSPSIRSLTKFWITQLVYYRATN